MNRSVQPEPAQRRTKRPHDTGVHERLVSAARECLRRDGVPGASSRAITTAAGVNLAAITYYFGSKDELVAAALADELRAWIAPALDALDTTADPATRLFDAVGHLQRAFDTARADAPALLEAFLYATRHHTASSPVTGLWSEARVRLARVVGELRSEGAVPQWIDPDAMASLILAVAGGTVLATAIEPGAEHRAIGAQFAALLLSAGSTGPTEPG